MNTIREAIRDIINDRILPWIERDGISNLILPEQITPADCARPIKCKRPCLAQHREGELGIGLTGNTPYCIENKTFIFTPGAMMLLPARTPHGPAQTRRRLIKDLDYNQPSSMLWLLSYPSGVWVQVIRIIEDTNTMEGTYPCVLLDLHFSKLMAWLVEEVQSRRPNYAGIGRGTMIEFMERCLRATSTDATVDILAVLPQPRRRSTSSVPSKTKGLTTGKQTKAKAKQIPGKVQAAQEFIHSNYPMPITLDNIAESADSSHTHLTRQFKAAIGMTPVQYLLNIRMAAARQLLLTDLKVFEVAHMVGIEDHCYFSRLFRRITGVSPIAYRLKMSKKAE